MKIPTLAEIAKQRQYCKDTDKAVAANALPAERLGEMIDARAAAGLDTGDNVADTRPKPLTISDAISVVQATGKAAIDAPSDAALAEDWRVARVQLAAAYEAHYAAADARIDALPDAAAVADALDAPTFMEWNEAQYQAAESRIAREALEAAHAGREFFRNMPDGERRQLRAVERP